MDRDGEEWASQRSIIQKLMMHPSAAARYMHVQRPVTDDFIKYLYSKRDKDQIVPDLYNDLFRYTTESELLLYIL